MSVFVQAFNSNDKLIYLPSWEKFLLLTLPEPTVRSGPVCFHRVKRFEETVGLRLLSPCLDSFYV